MVSHKFIPLYELHFCTDPTAFYAVSSKSKKCSLLGVPHRYGAKTAYQEGTVSIRQLCIGFNDFAQH